MYSQLFRFLQKPLLWQRSTEPFWDDEHISKGMLAAHLNPDWDAASRRTDFIDQSVRWIVSFCPSNGSILDLGCGPGLYCKRLSYLGFAVTGIDFSKRSIAFAKESDQRTTYIYQNYLDIEYVNAFDVILMIYCDFAALTPSEREALLDKVYLALKPNGIFVFDVFTDIHQKSKPLQNEWTVHEKGGFWSASPHVHLERTYSYADDTVTVNQNIIITEKEIKEYLIWDTVYNVQRLEAEVLRSGLQVSKTYGDACGNPYTEDSETLCLLARKPR